MRVAAGTPRAGRRPQELVADPDADASLSTALRKCLADACLDGEADQITEVVQNHVNFGAVRRSVRLEVEAELRQLMCRMNDCTDGLQSPRSAAVDVKSASSSAPSPSHASQHEGQGEGSAPWRNVDVPKGVPKLRRFQPARTYLSRAAAPEENGFNTSEAPGPRVSVPSPRAADIGRAAMSTPLSEASTSASSADAGTPRKGGKCTFAEGGVEQCPNEQDVTEGLTPSGTPKVHTRHSIARRLQERRRYEAGDADKVQDNRASASTVSSPSSNRRFGFNSEHTEQQDVEDAESWYSPPTAYKWCGRSASAYAFTPAAEVQHEASGTASNSPDTGSHAEPVESQSGTTHHEANPASGDKMGAGPTAYSMRFAKGEHRTFTQNANSRASGGPAPDGSKSTCGCGGGSGIPPCPPPPPMNPPRPPPAPGPVPPRPSAAGPSGFAFRREGMAPPCQGQAHPHRPRRWRSAGPSAPRAPGWSHGSGQRTSVPPPRKPQVDLGFHLRPPGEAAALGKLESRLQELRRKPLEDQRKGVKELMVQWHPDKNLDRGDEATRVFQWLQNRKKELLGL